MLSAPPTTEYCLTNFVLPGTPRLPAVSEVQFNLSVQTPSTISSTSRTEWICRDENRSIFGDQIPWRYKAGQFSWAHLMWCCCCCTQTHRAHTGFSARIYSGETAGMHFARYYVRERDNTIKIVFNLTKNVLWAAFRNPFLPDLCPMWYRSLLIINAEKWRIYYVLIVDFS